MKKTTIFKIAPFFLVAIFISGLLFAAVKLPDWNKEKKESEVTTKNWQLPEGCKPFRAGAAGVAVSSVGVTYVGHFIDNNGRTVLKGRWSQQNITASSWGGGHIDFKFEKALFDKINFEDSYILKNSSNVEPQKFKTPTSLGLIGLGDNEMLVPFNDAGSGSMRREFFLVLKEGVTWENLMADRDYLVSVRLYNSDVKEVWSKHSDHYKDPDLQLNYNTYTHSFVINKMEGLRDHLIDGYVEATGVPRGVVHTVATRAVFLPEENKLRVLYQYTHGALVSENHKRKAFKQGFENQFKPYLVPDRDGNIGKLHIIDHAFNPYSVPIKYTPIKESDLNEVSGKGGSYFVVADHDFRVPEGAASYHVIRVEKGQAGNTFFSGGFTLNPTVVVVEYNVNAARMQRDLFQDGETAYGFAFESEFLEEGHPEGIDQFVYTTDSELKIPRNSTVEVNYKKAYSGTHEDYHGNVFFGNNKALSLIYGSSKGQDFGALLNPRGMKYFVNKGFTVNKGTQISVVNILNNLSDLQSVNIKITDPSGKPIFLI